MNLEFKTLDDCLNDLSRRGVKAESVVDHQAEKNGDTQKVYALRNFVNNAFLGYFIHTKDKGRFFQINPIIEGNLGERPSWDEYFMTFAVAAASRSSCVHVKSGSVLVIDKQIVATGYNGAGPRRKGNCLENGCKKEAKGLVYEKSLGSGECIGIHSEVNALGRLDKKNLSGVTLYTTICPCHSCAKNLGPYNVGRVVFKSTYSGSELASTLEIFEDDGVVVERLDLTPERYVDILMGRPGRKFDVWPPEQREFIKSVLAVKN
jgi:dCMP deaminase